MDKNQQNARCQLSEWGLPPLIISWFKKKGVTSLFEWQVECLCKNDVLFGGNLVYSAPTSAGKTLVADFLLLKKVLEYNRKALVIEPFVALTREKAASLKSMLYPTKARVGAFGGNYYTPGGLAACNVAVCTIEKANNFVNKLVAENKLSDLGIIVVDEIHYLGDERRGHQLELLLTKVLFYNKQHQDNKKIQIIGLSATIPNLESIAVWLNASLYVTYYRPVPLQEKVKIADKIYDVNSYLRNPKCEPLHLIDNSRFGLIKDTDDLGYLCLESVVGGFSTLVFCESKRECEILAANLADQIKDIGNKLSSQNEAQVEVAKKVRSNLSKAKILDLMGKLKKCPAGPDKELSKSLSFGVAFHHAGLTTEERELIEDGFKSGAIKVLMATSTLSSGVNLPARRVIIRSPTAIYSGNATYQKDMLNPITYRQMIGRAGRKGIDTCGESILISTNENEAIAMKLIKASLGDINSSLGQRMLASEGEPSGLKKAVLEVIANNTAKTRIHLNQYLLSTFWLVCTTKQEDKEFELAINKTISYLVANKFIEELKPGLFRATRLGNAVLASGLHPDESLELVQDLIKARQGFCLLNDLHIIYQVTPNDIARSIELKDWQHYSKVWNELDNTCQYVGERVGIDEITIARRCQGFVRPLEEEKERVYRRFWIALVINDLVSEMQLPLICSKYRVTKAVVQQCQRAVAQFAGVMSIFCSELGYDNIAALVTPLESRINFSCQRDLLDLIRLNITRPIARSLFNHGYKTIIAVAKGDKLDIEFVIRQMKPFKKEKSFTLDGDEAPTMWVPELAKTMTVLDYASNIVDTARSYVEIEYDIDLGSTINKRKVNDQASDGGSLTPSESESNEMRAAKKGRLEDGPSNSSDIHEFDQNPDILGMAKANRDVPNFVTEYVGQDERSVCRFMEKWIQHSSISLNFKLDRHINNPIGCNVKETPKSKKELSKTPRTARSGEKIEEDYDLDDGSDCDSQEEFTLDLEIDSKKHIVTRLYVSFDEELKVYIIDSNRVFKRIKTNLNRHLKELYTSTVSQRAHQPEIEPIKLYTQNIVLTYKVLYAAFGLDKSVLFNCFEWHAFDVAWWMVNQCPNRGLNNRNSSLSLVSKTKWAMKYHHFLYPSSRKNKRRAQLAELRSSPFEERSEFLRLKDIVKSGKTAILQPLIKEILVELAALDQLDAYSKSEVPSRLTMAHMMVSGIGLNMKFMRSELALYEDLLQQLTDIAQKYYAKSPILLTNIRHVARVLYEDLNLKEHLLNYCTNSDISKDPTNGEILTILSKYHPFPKLVQDFRKIGKALEALQSVSTFARFNSELNMMRVFGQCDFWQLTGRVAMFEPDLFLINRTFNVVIPAHGNREEEVVECAPRRCFVPSKGWLFVAADYSQLELRLLAHFANDEKLLEILNRSLDTTDATYDVFKTVAAKIYQITSDDITSEQRQHAKQICYGIIYGMGNRSLSIQLGVGIEEADQFRQDFFNAFPRIRAYTEDLIKECQESDSVKSLLNRRRTVIGLNSDSPSAKSRAERVAINTRIQSSASDIIKLAMTTVNEKVLETFDNNVRLVLEMHDELIYEVNPPVLDRFSIALKETMENIRLLEGLRVKLLVNLKKGTDWSRLSTFKP